MMISRAMYEQQILDELQDVPLPQFPKVIHLLHLIKEEFLADLPKYQEQTDVLEEETAKAVAAVHETWGGIPLDREMVKYFAEDKEIEYEPE